MSRGPEPDPLRSASVITVADGYAKPDNNFNLLRLVAAWLVIYGHAWAITGDHQSQDIFIQLLQFKFAGGIAVDAFFFISGFLIAASFERNTVRGYLVARSLRILPALVVCVALSVLLLGPLMTTDKDYLLYRDTWRYLWMNPTLIDVEYRLPGVFEHLPNKAVNGPLWTLDIEARLYLGLLALGLAGLLRPARFNPLFVAVLACGFLLVAPGSLDSNWSNYAYTTAFFGAGVFAWLNRDSIPLSWPVLCCVLVFAASLLRTDRFYVGYCFALAYGVLFLAFVPRIPIIRGVDMSYGLYLYGWPSGQVVQTLWPGGPYQNAVLTTVLAGTMAALSWHFVEKPALRLKSRFGARPDPHSLRMAGVAGPTPARDSAAS